MYAIISDSGRQYTVKEGDVVIYAKFGGTELKIDSTEYLVVKESDLLAVKQ